jgi:hypothetical protein
VTYPEFEQALWPLRVLRGWPQKEDAAEKLGVYWQQFQHAEAVSFERGCAHAVRTRAFFPTPAELYADCEATAPRETWIAERRDAQVDDQIVHIPNPFGGNGLTVRVSKVWEYDCDDCSDGGTVSFWCGTPGVGKKPWQLVVPCGNRHEHTPHEYVTRCGCWDRNPSLIRKRAAQAQHARGGKHEAA